MSCTYQTFQLLTGKPLFNPRNDPQGRFSADDEHLLHMMQLTGQTFEAGMLNTSAKAGEFFESNGEDPITCIILSTMYLIFIDLYRKSYSNNRTPSTRSVDQRCPGL
jgi:hypothetical protein